MIMYILKTQRRFEKDTEKLKARGKKLSRMWAVVEKIQTRQPLEAKHRPHKLIGNWEGFWECHIEPDWLLIYRFNGQHLELSRTGTHSDLF